MDTRPCAVQAIRGGFKVNSHSLDQVGVDSTHALARWLSAVSSRLGGLRCAPKVSGKACAWVGGCMRHLKWSGERSGSRGGLPCALVAFFLSAWPATAYINAAEATLRIQDSPVHTAIGFGMAGAWSAALWFKYRAKIRILWIPTFYFWLAIGMVMAFRQ